MSIDRKRKKNNEAILDVEEYGILCMTCPYTIDEQLIREGNFIYTSKEAYLWVPIISYLVRETDLESKDIKVFLELAMDALSNHYKAKWSNRTESLEVILELINSMLFYCTRKKLEGEIFKSHETFASSIEDVIERLERLGLIKEHFKRPSVEKPINVMGFVPFGFTQRTKLGEELLTKLDSMMQFYVMKKLVDDSDFQIHHKFHVTWQQFQSIILSIGNPSAANK